MTVSIPIGKFKTQVKKPSLIGTSIREAELDIWWHSCGIYTINGSFSEEPTETEVHAHIQQKLKFDINLTPQFIEKVIELYPSATKRERKDCHLPFYQEYDFDRSMFDLGQDTLLQAFKDNSIENRIVLTNYNFSYGNPNSLKVLNLDFEEFKRLKEFLDNGPEIFYSGCRVRWPTEEDIPTKIKISKPKSIPPIEIKIPKPENLEEYE